MHSLKVQYEGKGSFEKGAGRRTSPWNSDHSIRRHGAIRNGLERKSLTRNHSFTKKAFVADQIQYVVMEDAAKSPMVCQLMEALYIEDAAASGDGRRAFSATIEHLLNYPDDGQIVLFLNSATTQGYALLIPYWSNEFGGKILFVDELYVAPDARGQGIARGLFSWIAGQRPFGAVAVFVEVSPANHRARSLYESLGLSERSNRTLAKRLPPMIEPEISGKY